MPGWAGSMETVASSLGCGADHRPIFGGVAIVNQADRKAMREALKGIEEDIRPLLDAIERIDPAKAEADPESMAKLFGLLASCKASAPDGFISKLVQAFRTAGFSEEFITQHYGKRANR